MDLLARGAAASALRGVSGAQVTCITPAQEWKSTQSQAERLLRERLPTAPAGAPQSLEWSGFSCTPDFMIWNTQETLTREGFIQRTER